MDGVLSLNLESVAAAAKDGRPEFHIVTRDGRRLEHLSTGQRAQVAVSLLTAQNQALTPYLDHHMLLLDDVSTAYDLSNLVREAILWRQLAYGGDDGWNTQRRQVFLSSHHEDLSNLMLDLLVPPQGRTMRLIRFTGWSPTEGPVFESFAVEPGETTAHGIADGDELKAALGAF